LAAPTPEDRHPSLEPTHGTVTEEVPLGAGKTFATGNGTVMVVE
jgi:hypothetical protein